jgi:hypothetical protein
VHHTTRTGQYYTTRAVSPDGNIEKKLAQEKKTFIVEETGEMLKCNANRLFLLRQTFLPSL